MKPKEERIRTLVAEEAADWFVANRAGLAGDEIARFNAWLKASPTNVEEYLGVALIARDLRAACTDPQLSPEALLTRARAEDAAAGENRVTAISAAARPAPVRHWQFAAACVAALGVLSVGGFLWRDWQVTRAPAPVATASTTLHFETRHGEQLRRRLADDSVLQLNTDTAVTVTYSETERRVVIERGQADFEVAHNPQRPFRVFGGSAQIVAVGTKFDVYVQHDSTVVTVIEGKVAVGLSPLLPNSGAEPRSNRSTSVVQVGADQQVRVSEDAWPAIPVAVNAQRTTAWLRRQIVFEHEPLERVAAEFNRYAPAPIEIVTPALRNLQVSGVFATDDPESFIAFLRTLDGVRVEATTTRIRVSRR
jgi:transmembrane sensor